MNTKHKLNTRVLVCRVNSVAQACQCSSLTICMQSLSGWQLTQQVLLTNRSPTFIHRLRLCCRSQEAAPIHLESTNPTPAILPLPTHRGPNHGQVMYWLLIRADCKYRGITLAMYLALIEQRR